MIGGLDPTTSGILYTAGGGLVLMIAAAVARTWGKRQTEAKDAQGLREFFFDTPANPRNGVPAKKGWTTLVDERQTRMDRKLDEVLQELKPNGGTNLRGAVDRVDQKLEDS